MKMTSVGTGSLRPPAPSASFALARADAINRSLQMSLFFGSEEIAPQRNELDLSLCIH